MFKYLKSLLPTVIKTVQVPAPPSVFKEQKYMNGRELAAHDTKGVVKLGVIVGHTADDPGAKMVAPFNLHEYAYNLVVAELMEKYANTNPCGVYVEVILRDKIGIVGAYDKARALLCDAVIELHFNAADGKASGSLTLSSADTSDMEFAHEINKAMCDVFRRIGAENRGVSAVSKSARGGINVHSFPGSVNCLVEPFFGDNAKDAKLGVDTQAAYAKALVDAVALWGKKIDLIKA